jgi:hypothetical protein
VASADPDSRLVLTDAIVSDTRPRALDSGGGFGIGVRRGSRLEATRVLVVGNRETGVGVSDEGTTASLTDVAIRDTRERGSDLTTGYGLITQFGATTNATRLVVAGAREFGIVSISNGDITLESVSVTDVVTSACACDDRVYGHALSGAGARLSVTDFVVRNAATCGLFVSLLPGFTSVAEVDLSDGLVEAAAIGACVQVVDYDLNRLTTDVVFRDNGANLDTTRLPVPTTLDSL